MLQRKCSNTDCQARFTCGGGCKNSMKHSYQSFCLCLPCLAKSKLSLSAERTGCDALPIDKEELKEFAR